VIDAGVAITDLYLVDNKVSKLECINRLMAKAENHTSINNALLRREFSENIFRLSYNIKTANDPQCVDLKLTEFSNTLDAAAWLEIHVQHTYMFT